MVTTLMEPVLQPGPPDAAPNPEPVRFGMVTGVYIPTLLTILGVIMYLRLGWTWFSRIKKNRMVNPDHTDNRPVSSLTIPDDGLNVHMKKFGFVRVFHTVNTDGKERYWATNFLTMDHLDRRNLQAICRSIENYHRALKELCCVEDCKIRKEAGQRNHINCSIRAFIRLEVVNRIKNIPIYNAKWEIVKSAIVDCLVHPKYAL